jgi:hypothetical protein
VRHLEDGVAKLKGGQKVVQLRHLLDVGGGDAVPTRVGVARGAKAAREDRVEAAQAGRQYLKLGKIRVYKMIYNIQMYSLTYRAKVGVLGDVLADLFVLPRHGHAVYERVPRLLADVSVPVEVAHQEGKDQKLLLARRTILDACVGLENDELFLIRDIGKQLKPI